MAQIARQTAVPCTLAEITAGQFVQNPGLEPSGVRTNRGMISRCSILGVIIDKNQTGITLEDGTTAISVRTFDQRPILANVGDLVLVIGRPREYNGERYLALEICKRLKNPAWVQYRRKELSHSTEFVVAHDEIQETPIPAIPATATKNPFEAIIDAIRSNDKGNGADIEEVIAAVPGAQQFVRTLIEEGEIFEIRPGRLKVLE
jgi:hypothetical protein